MPDFLTSINLNSNELQNAVIQNLASDPTSPKVGRVWYNTSDVAFKIYNGISNEVLLTLAAANTTYQTIIAATGLLKGNGGGVISAASAGTDYQAPITGAASTIASSNLTASRALASDTSGKVAVSNVTATELGYLSGVTSAIQTQLNAKQATITGAATTIVSSDLTVSRALASDTSGKVAVSSVTSTELGYLSGVTSAIQTQLGGKQTKITASGILKGDGSGGVTAASAGTDYQAVISGAATTITTSDLTVSRALVSNSSGKVAVSTVTATELGYLSGVTGAIQTQLDNIPKYNFQTGVACSVADGASQATIDTSAITAITAAHSAPAKWDACVAAITFTPSDVKKDGQYYYNGSTWIFQYYVSTGIQVANGTTAGIVESSTDITFSAGTGVVNHATAADSAATWTTTRTITITGVTATAQNINGSGNVSIPITAIPTSLLTGTLGVDHGGTGATTFTSGSALIGNGTGAVTTKAIDTTVTQSSANLVTSGAVYTALATAGQLHKYSETNPSLTPSGGTCTWTVTHGLGTRAVITSVAEAASPYNVVICDVANTSTTQTTITIASATTIAAGTYEFTAIG